MKKKGFTLVELLAVLSILAILAVIIMPIITSSITQSEEKAYNNQIDSLISAAKKWGASNSKLLSTEESIALSFTTLFDEGYINQKKVINPMTEQELVGCIKISYDLEYSQYRYEYTNDDAFCSR